MTLLEAIGLRRDRRFCSMERTNLIPATPIKNRPARLLCMRMGVDLGGTKIEAAVLDDAGEIQARMRVLTPKHYEPLLETIASLVRELEQQIGSIRTIGIATPGALSPRTGLMHNAHNTALHEKPFDVDLERVLGRPIRVANDAHCFALSEATDGAGAGGRSVFGVIVGTGASGALVVDGKVFPGKNAVAGEWGHNPLPWPQPDEYPGPRCYCGKHGCTESYLSGPGLIRDHQLVTGEELPPELIVARAAEGDANSQATLARYADRMARALATVINLVDPDVIVLGGGLSHIKSLYEVVPERWGNYVLAPHVATPLLPNRHGDASAVRGAAWLWSPRPIVGRA